MCSFYKNAKPHLLFRSQSRGDRWGEILEKLQEARPVTAVAETAISQDDTLTYDENAVDPHLWMDVSLWRGTVDVMTQALSELNPDCSDDMSERARELKNELAALDTLGTRQHRQYS